MNRSPFKTDSQVKPSALKGPNKALYEYLASGKAISFMQARSLGITNLGTKVSILRDAGITVYERAIRISNIQCMEYSLQPFKDTTGNPG